MTSCKGAYINQLKLSIWLEEGENSSWDHLYLEFAYTQEKLFAYLMQSKFYCGTEKRAYLNVKLLSSGYTCKLLESRESILLHHQPHKFSALVSCFKNSSIFSAYFPSWVWLAHFTTWYVTVVFYSSLVESFHLGILTKILPV